MPVRVTSYTSNDACVSTLYDTDRPLIIGRSDSVDVILNDNRVSRRHAQLVPDLRTWRIEDLGSKNGTRVAGRPVTTTVISDGETWISIGGVPIKLEISNSVSKQLIANNDALAFDASRSLSEILDDCLEAFLEVSNCERASIWSVSDGGDVALMARRGAHAPSESVTALEHVARSKKLFLENDLVGAGALAESESILSGGIRALICAPLMAGGKVRGLLYADSQEVAKAFTQTDVEMIENIADQAGICFGARLISDALSGHTSGAA